MIDQNTADALNKALDLAKQGVVGAFETVKQYAPFVWGMARRQTLIDGVECFIFAGLTTAIATTLSTIYYRAYKNDSFDGEDLVVGNVITWAISLGIGLTALVNGIDFFFNPDWWTMKAILEMVKK